MAQPAVIGCFTFVGFFGLGAAEAPQLASGVTRYAFYDVNIHTTSGENVLGRLRMYCPDSVPHPLGTIVFAIVKATAPATPTEVFTLDSMLNAVVPGDPTAEDYGDNLPPFETPVALIIGHVASGSLVIQTPQGDKSGFRIETSEYMYDRARSSPIYATYDTGSPRWRRTPNVAALNSCVGIVALPYCRANDGIVCFDVLNVLFNLGVRTLAMIKASTPHSSPTKKRRFLPPSSPDSSGGGGPHASGSGSGPSAGTSAFNTFATDPTSYNSPVHVDSSLHLDERQAPSPPPPSQYNHHLDRLHSPFQRSLSLSQHATSSKKNSSRERSEELEYVDATVPTDDDKPSKSRSEKRVLRGKKHAS